LRSNAIKKDPQDGRYIGLDIIDHFGRLVVLIPLVFPTSYAFSVLPKKLFMWSPAKKEQKKTSVTKKVRYHATMDQPKSPSGYYRMWAALLASSFDYLNNGRSQEDAYHIWAV
jgi:hypothetical protein